MKNIVGYGPVILLWGLLAGGMFIRENWREIGLTLTAGTLGVWAGVLGITILPYILDGMNHVVENVENGVQKDIVLHGFVFAFFVALASLIWNLYQTCRRVKGRLNDD